MPEPATRRRSAEVRRLLVESAVRVFAARGFADAALDEIARDAGVARSALYRHFSGKPELFVEAVLHPFVEVLDGYRAFWAGQVDRPWDDERFMRTLVALIHDTCAAHRDTLLSLAAATGSVDDRTRRLLEGSVAGLLDDLVHTVQPESDRRGWVPPESLSLSLRVMIGSIASVTVLDDVFLPARGDHPLSRDQIVDHVTALFLHGARLTGDESAPAPTVFRRDPPAR